MTWCFKANLQLPRGQLSFVETWPLMNSHELLFVLFTYFSFVFKVGPYLMENRNPFQIKRLLLFYNIIKVVNSGFLCYKFFSYIMDKGIFPRRCEYDDSTIFTVATLYWKYMIAKTLDLWDTVFFVLRKKNSQITFLHVYHHVFMFVITWMALKYEPSDHWAFMAFMNCGIHTVMYTYYALSTLGPGFAKYLWWKKYFTLMQLIQFVLITVHIVIQTYTSQCPIHPGTYWAGLGNLGLFFILFVDFYKQRYLTKKNKAQDDLCAMHVD